MADTSPAIVRDLVDRQAREHEVDILAVEVKGQGSRQLVRIVVDRKGGISVGACQQISQDLSRELDSVDPIGGRYTLEVTSPGVDWPLTDRQAFDRVEGRVVRIQRRVGGDGVEHVKGHVVGAGPTAVQINDDGTVVTVAYDDIVTAAQALPW